MRMRIKKEKRELGMANILVFDALTLQVARDPVHVSSLLFGSKLMHTALDILQHTLTFVQLQVVILVYLYDVDVPL